MTNAAGKRQGVGSIQTAEAFLVWCRAELKALGEHPEPGPEECDNAGHTVRDCGKIAAYLGMSEIASRCLITGPTGVNNARRLIALAIEACLNRPPDPDAKFDANAAASYLNTSVKALYGLVHRRRIEPMRGTRGKYLFTKTQLDEYLGRR